MSGPTFDHPDVILCPDGPMLLRGDHIVEDADGVAHPTSRPVSAVCRCGKSPRSRGATAPTRSSWPATTEAAGQSPVYAP